MTDKDLLKDAAETIRSRGWCQGQYTDDEGRCCVIGAIRDAMSKARIGDDRARVWERLYTKVSSVVYHDADAFFKSLSGWNDKAGRTAEEVITALETAAEIP